MQAGEGIIGIDISKESFDMVLRRVRGEVHKVFANNQKGYAAMVIWVEKQPERIERICMEATGS